MSAAASAATYNRGMVAPAQEGTPRADLERDIKDALRARENEKLQTLRMLLADVKNKSIEAGRDVDRDEFTALVRKSIKQRHEAAQQYEQGNRPELRDKELREVGDPRALPAGAGVRGRSAPGDPRAGGRARPLRPERDRRR